MEKTVVLVSDVHIKNRLWTNFAGIQGDAYIALQKITSTQDASHNVCISCGDFFDSNRPTSKDLTEASDFIQSFETFLYVSGNHDDAEPPLPEALDRRRVKRLTHEIPYILDNLQIFGCSFTADKELLTEQLQAMATYIFENPSDRKTLIVLHQSFEGLQANPMVTMSLLESIFSTPVTVFIGDTHLNKKCLKNNITVVSPGALVPQNKAEALLDHYIYKINSTTGEFKKQPIEVRNYVIFNPTEEECPVFEEHADLPTVCFVKSDSIKKEWKDLNPQVIFITDPVKTEEQSASIIETSNMSLDDAIVEELTSVDNAVAGASNTLIAIYNAIKNVDEPDVLLSKLLDKWKVRYDKC